MKLLDRIEEVPVNYLLDKFSDLNTVRIKTTHPVTKEIVIYVRYAVTP